MALEHWRPRWSPARAPLGDAMRARDLDDLVGRFVRDWGWGNEGDMRGWSPAVDVLDQKDAIVVRADLPGVDPKEVHVSVENGVLTIRGERKNQSETRDAEYHCCERWSGAFARSLSLPPQVDTSSIRATFKQGMLEIHLPKAKEALGRRIEVQAT